MAKLPSQSSASGSRRGWRLDQSGRRPKASTSSALGMTSSRKAKDTHSKLKVTRRTCCSLLEDWGPDFVAEVVVVEMGVGGRVGCEHLESSGGLGVSRLLEFGSDSVFVVGAERDFTVTSDLRALSDVCRMLLPLFGSFLLLQEPLPELRGEGSPEMLAFGPASSGSPFVDCSGISSVSLWRLFSRRGTVADLSSPAELINSLSLAVTVTRMHLLPSWPTSVTFPPPEASLVVDTLSLVVVVVVVLVACAEPPARRLARRRLCL